MKIGEGPKVLLNVNMSFIITPLIKYLYQCKSLDAKGFPWILKKFLIYCFHLGCFRTTSVFLL
jgi:hypothetical protein